MRLDAAIASEAIAQTGWTVSAVNAAQLLEAATQIRTVRAVRGP